MIEDNPHTCSLQVRHCNPLVSIIIPVYNRERLVVETLDSLRSQCYRPLEVIVVDDGSTDDTMAEMLRWRERAKADHELQCHLMRQENKGAAAARNLGKSLATGKYIHFLDSDDVVGAFFYTTLVRVMESEPDCAFAWGTWITAEDAVDAALKLFNPHSAAPTENSAPPNNAWCGLYRAGTLPFGLDWDDSLPNHNDWSFTTRFLLSNPGRLLCLPADLMVYRTHRGAERLGLRETRDSLMAAINSAEQCSVMMDRRHPYAKVLNSRFATEFLLLLCDAMAADDGTLKVRATRGLLRHVPFRHSYHLNLIAVALLGLLPFSSTRLGKRGLRMVRRSIGDKPGTA